MRIALVSPRTMRFCNKRPTSGDMIARNLAEKSRFRDTICAFGHPVEEKVPTLQFQEITGHGQAWLRLAFQKIMQFEPDIIEVHQHLPTAVYLAKKFPKRPVICFKHNPISAQKNILRRWSTTKSLETIAHVVFVSDYCLLEFTRDWPQYLHKASVLQNAIAPENWLGPLGKRDKVISFVGRAVPDKGVEPLLDALRSILDSAKDWNVLLITTRGSKYPKLAKKIADFRDDFSSQVDWLQDQPLEQVQELVKRAAISVVPSVWQEPFGLTALEAHLAGAALISSGRGGLREVSGPHALYLDEVSPNALAKALNCLMADEELRLELQDKAQKYVLETFDLQKQAEKMDELRYQLVKKIKVSPVPAEDHATY